MASQITHIVYGKKIFDRLNSNFDWTQFATGTTFPDIRYLAKVPRNLTHTFSTSEEKIPVGDAFKAGRYVHCLVDEKREKYLSSSGLYRIVPRDILHAGAMKLWEDVVVYELYTDWEGLIAQIKKLSFEKSIVGIKVENIKCWYEILTDYFSTPPTLETIKKQLLEMGFEFEKVEALMETVSGLQKNKDLLKMIKSTYNAI